MKQKTNIAQLLKDCPKGMELYSPLCGKCVFDRLINGTIICKKQNTQEITFTSEGYYMLPVFDNCECMIFPSENQRDWSKFQKLFEDGDIVATMSGNWIGITIGGEKNCYMPTYCIIKSNGEFEAYFNKKEKWVFDRLATKEEREKLFKAIKDNGYRWNTETKNLDKLIEPKFKVGDRIQLISPHYIPIHIIKSLEWDRYRLDNGNYIKFGDEDAYKLLKFDISTLKPFDKVLVRNNSLENWHIQFFDSYNKEYGAKYPFVCMQNIRYSKCIPYEGNEHLHNTVNDCSPFFKTW